MVGPASASLVTDALKWWNSPEIHPLVEYSMAAKYPLDDWTYDVP